MPTRSTPLCLPLLQDLRWFAPSARWLARTRRGPHAACRARRLRPCLALTSIGSRQRSLTHWRVLRMWSPTACTPSWCCPWASRCRITLRLPGARAPAPGRAPLCPSPARVDVGRFCLANAVLPLVWRSSAVSPLRQSALAFPASVPARRLLLPFLRSPRTPPSPLVPPTPRVCLPPSRLVGISPARH